MVVENVDGPPLATRGKRVFVALHEHLPLLGEQLR
jgi:hypothetical protein